MKARLDIELVLPYAEYILEQLPSMREQALEELIDLEMTSHTVWTGHLWWMKKVPAYKTREEALHYLKTTECRFFIKAEDTHMMLTYYKHVMSYYYYTREVMAKRIISMHGKVAKYTSKPIYVYLADNELDWLGISKELVGESKKA
jgi:hypothetical protein